MKSITTVVHKYQPKTKEELINLVEDLSIKLWEIDTSLITDMSNLFFKSKRQENEDFEGIWSWNVRNVVNMSGLFKCCYHFNQPLNDWNVSNVVNMKYMFQHCFDFNQPLNDWNVSNVLLMNEMFRSCHNFNQPLDKWDVSKVFDIESMFAFCINFNQPLSKWNVNNAKYVRKIFCFTPAFDQDISNWQFRDGADTSDMFKDCFIREEYKPKCLK